MLFLCLLIAITTFAAGKKREWQTGKVLDSERSRYFAGTVGSGNTTGNAQANGNYATYRGNTSTSETAVYRVYQTFLIEGETTAYLVQEQLVWRWSKGANITVNGSVKFAIDKRKLYVIDEDSKEHEMEILKKVLRVPEPPK
jgi:CRISPR/Cas system-associated protein Cas7 (RAMP superfamily)